MNFPKKQQVIKKKSLGDQAYESLVELIFSGELPAGTILQERDLANKLKISRTPIREALARMTAEEMIKRDARRALIVREISAQEMMELLHVRRLLEVEAAGLAAGNVPSEQLNLLRNKVVHLMQNQNPSSVEHRIVDEHIHGLIADHSRNQLLSSIIRDLHRKTKFFNMVIIPDRFFPGCREHINILDAISNNDPEGAREAMKHHIGNVKESILQTLGELYSGTG